MCSVETALDQVLDIAQALPIERRAVRDCLGLVLAEDVLSDVDSPPHDKALMDGYAVRSQDLHGGIGELIFLEEIPAGKVPTKKLLPGTTSRIFTGAQIPDGSDSIVIIERSEIVTDGDLQKVRLTDPTFRAGQHWMRRGQSMRRDEVVLHCGHTIRPIEIGSLSEVGKSEIKVHRRPRVAILATGDELVPVDRIPGPGQIRNSNGPMLSALVQEAGGEPINLDIAIDDENELRQRVERGLECDVLVLSGGVSAGAFDLVPKVLADVGVKQIFHKIKLKPGKPVWFGSTKRESQEKLVFGLPGNPVSSLVCFELFVRPALKKMLGRIDWTMSVAHGRLTNPFRHRGDRPTYYPARARQSVFQESADGAILRIDLMDWQGSADLKTLTSANCLAYFPSGDRAYEAGEEITIYWLM